MKSSTDFILENLNRIHDIFPFMSIRYEYRDCISTHIIEVKPVDKFENDSDYIIEEVNFQEEFEQLYFDQEILFISDNSLSKIKSPSFILEPKLKEEEFAFHCDLTTDFCEFQSTEIYFTHQQDFILCSGTLATIGYNLVGNEFFLPEKPTNRKPKSTMDQILNIFKPKNPVEKQGFSICC